jgi:DNA-binding MarR family transcriptional regulator
MNELPEKNQDSYRSFLLMSEIEKEETLSQRELSLRLGIALGLVNSYLKNLVGKGFVRVKAFPRNRYAYLLTPKGIAEKSRLAYQHLNYFTSLYTSTRREYLELFSRLKAQGVSEVVFCGVDEVAEIAYLSLQEAGLELEAVMDEGGERRELFGHLVHPVTAVLGRPEWEIVVTSLKRRSELVQTLENLGVGTAVYLPG